MQRIISHCSMVGRADGGVIGTNRVVGSKAEPLPNAKAFQIDRRHTLLHSADEEDDLCPVLHAEDHESSDDETQAEQRTRNDRMNQRGFNSGANLDAVRSEKQKWGISLNNADVANINCNTKAAFAQLPWAQTKKKAAETTRSTDPRLRAPEFQEHRENRTIEAFGSLQLHLEARALPQPTAINDEISPDRLRVAVPLPPTPPRRSQKRLVGEESRWSDDDDDGPLTTADGAGMIDKDADSATASEEGQDEKEMAREGSSVGGDEEDLIGGHASCAVSPGSNRAYTQEELVILTRKIFGEEDATFWDDWDDWDIDVDGASRAAFGHPGEQEFSHTDMVDQQGEESDIRGESGEGEVNEGSKSDGLFGRTSNAYSSTLFDGGHPHPHQKEDEDENAAVVEDVLEAAADSATTDISDDVNLSENGTPSTAIPSTLPTSPGCPITPLHSSPPVQLPSPSPESGSGTHLSKDRNSKPGDSLEVDVGGDGSFSDMMLVLAAQVTPPNEVLEPRKPAVAVTNEEGLPCSTTRRMIRKKGLPEFSSTRPSIFGPQDIESSDEASTGKRKRSHEDDSDVDERASSSVSDPQGDRGVLPPRATKRLKFEENSRERSLNILAFNRPPEPEPVKRRTGLSGAPPQFQLHDFNLFNEIGSPSKAPPVFGDLPWLNLQVTKIHTKDNKGPSTRGSTPHMTRTPSSAASATAIVNATAINSRSTASGDSTKCSTKEPSSLLSVPTPRKGKINEDREDDSYTSDPPCSPIQEISSLAYIPPPTAKSPQCAAIEAYYMRLMPLKRTDRVSYPHASETLEEMAEIIKGLDITDPVGIDEKASFPRKDYTPYVTHVDCRDTRRPRHLGSSSSILMDGVEVGPYYSLGLLSSTTVDPRLACQQPPDVEQIDALHGIGLDFMEDMGMEDTGMVRDAVTTVMAIQAVQQRPLSAAITPGVHYGLLSNDQSCASIQTTLAPTVPPVTMPPVTIISPPVPVPAPASVPAPLPAPAVPAHVAGRKRKFTDDQDASCGLIDSVTKSLNFPRLKKQKTEYGIYPTYKRLEVIKAKDRKGMEPIKLTEAIALAARRGMAIWSSSRLPTGEPKSTEGNG